MQRMKVGRATAKKPRNSNHMLILSLPDGAHQSHMLERIRVNLVRTEFEARSSRDQKNTSLKISPVFPVQMGPMYLSAVCPKPKLSETSRVANFTNFQCPDDLLLSCCMQTFLSNLNACMVMCKCNVLKRRR